MVAVNGPGDGARLLLTVLLAGWVLAYAYSAIELSALWEPSDPFEFGFDVQPAVRFLGWQGVAAVLALGVFGVSRLWPRGAAARQIGNVPLLLALLLIAALGAIAVMGPPVG